MKSNSLEEALKSGVTPEALEKNFREELEKARRAIEKEQKQKEKEYDRKQELEKARNKAVRAMWDYFNVLGKPAGLALTEDDYKYGQFLLNSFEEDTLYFFNKLAQK